MPFAFSNQEYADIHFLYGLSNGNALEARREYRRRYPLRRLPQSHVFTAVHRRISETGNVRRVVVRGDRQPRRRRRALNLLQRRRNARVLGHFGNNPTTSVRQAERHLALPRSTIWDILRGDRMRAFHFQPVQGLHPGDNERRMEFCRWLLLAAEEEPRFLNQVLWTDEAIFTRRGVVNFHNLHTWSHENPRQVRPRSFQREFSINVWCGLIGNQLIGPFILPPRLNAALFLEFLREELNVLLEDLPLQLRRDHWIQLDGAPPHFGRNVRNWLHENYPERWIGRGGPVEWPPRSPDLTPLDFYVWGTMKNLVYVTPVATQEELLARIMQAANQLSPGQNLNASNAVQRRSRACIEANGGHFEQNL